MIRKFIKSATGRGDIFYKLTLPKLVIEILGWDKCKTLLIGITNKAIILSAGRKSEKQVALIHRKENGRISNYSITIPRHIENKFKIDGKKQASIKLNGKRLIITPINIK